MASPLPTRIRAAVRLRAAGLRESTRLLVLRYMPSEGQYVFALTVIIGAVCGLVAVGFHLSIRLAERLLIDRAMHAQGWSWAAWTIVTPTLGGLIAGAALTFLVPEARGSGIPQVKHAFAQPQGRIRLRDAAGKFLVSVLQIGSGASLGREGPTVFLTAATADLFSRLGPLAQRSRKRLMPVGVAAGIAAAFNAPIAAVTFTIEEIVGTLDQTVLSGVVVAAAVAAVIERSVLGVEPVIHLDHAYRLEHASSLPLYALLGVWAGFVSILFTDGILEVRQRFKKLERPPRWSQPAVGGFVTGVIAVLVMGFMHTGGVTGGGYEALGQALAGNFGVQVLVALLLAKIVSTVFSYSSGGAGGVFAPALCVGALAGGIVGWLDVAALGHTGNELGAFALVGMGAAFAGIIRAPITSVLIIFEMTGGYGLVLPLMISNMIAYALARHFRPVPLYDALLEQDGVHLPSRAGGAQSLEQLPIEKAMTPAPVALAMTQSAAEAVQALAGRTFSVCPALDSDGRLFGVVALAALRKAVAEGKGSVQVGELATPAETANVGTPLHLAAARMSRTQTRQLVVLDERGALAGVLTMSDVMKAHARAASVETTAGPRAPPQDSLLAIKVGLLAIDATPVPPSTPLTEVLDRLISAKGGALPLECTDGNYSVLILEHVRELWPEGEQLSKLLLATDVARSARPVSPAADLLQALRSMDEQGVDALPVVDGADGGQPRAVLTRADLGRFLFGHYARAAEAR